MNYEIIKDEQILKDFIEWLPVLNDGETFYLCLFARNKYCKELVHIKSDKAQLKRFTSKKEDLYRKIKQLECPLGAYMQKETPVPQEALALYITVNPRNMWRATFGSLVHLAKCIQNDSKTVNPHQEVLSEIQRTKSRTCWVDFDLDSKDLNPIELTMELEKFINITSFDLLETRGGYHILVDPSTVQEQFRKTWYNNLKQMPGIDQTGDCMIPVPGCTQGNFTPKFV